MEYRVLGSLEVLDDSGQRLPLGGARQQTVLGSLLVHAGHAVPLEQLVDELWASPPDSATKTVQVYVSRLRRLLPPQAIESRAGGYALDLNGASLDAQRFDGLAEEGRASLASGDHERAAALLRDALALWRGPALAGLDTEPLRREADRLEALRLQALEDRIEADLGRGRERDAVPELQALVAEHPFRERLRGQLMIALYRTGRQTDALEVYREGRMLLSDELGLEPGAELRALEQRILAHDPELELAATASPPQPSPAVAATAPSADTVRGRRPATVLFADVVDSTTLGEQLDPESFHRILERYSEIANDVLARHGGVVEKFIGDAVVAFFGMADLHEDDALRAVRAAVELRNAVAELRDELVDTDGVELAVRFGVNSGDVFVGSGGGREPFATGDSVNVAARLQQLAEAGEILLGERTYRLVEGAVRAEGLEPLVVKGRNAPVLAWRVLDLTAPDAVPRRATTALVGRTPELERLRAVYAPVADGRVCRLCTIVGPAGIGKSRLVAEFLAELAGSATVAVGRCLSYGEGITYHPIVEIVKQLLGDDLERELSPEGRDELEKLVMQRLRGALGLSAEEAPAEETFWAVRRLFETAAADRPLVAVFEDIHWAEPMLLDLLEYLVGFTSDAPIFLLCLARPEVLEERASWAAPDVARSLLALQPLTQAESQALVAAVGGEIGSVAAARIVETAEGNPLFLEQLVAAQAEGGEADALPPTLEAVLAARIANLDPPERRVLEHAAVEGRSFRWSSLSALLSDVDGAALGQHLMGLVRRQLIEPDPSRSAGEDAFRFAHILVQEAAYNAVPKELCGELHERLARGFGDGPEVEDEVVGYHLERAYRCREQVGVLGADGARLAQEARERLEAGARKSFLRGDPAAAAGLLDRAAALLPTDDPSRLALLPALGTALFEAGHLHDAETVLAEAIDASADDVLTARAQVEQQFVRLQTRPGAMADLEEVANSALRVFETQRDDSGQSRAWCLKASIAWNSGQARAADEAWCEAAEHARRAGERRELFEILDWRASAAVFGPAPVDEAIELCLDIRDQVRGSPVAFAETLHPLAVLLAMRGDFDDARAMARDGNVILDELGRMYSAGISHHEAYVEMLAGQPAAAEERLLRAYGRLDEMGEKGLLATTAAMLSQTLYAQGRLEQAAEFVRLSGEAAGGEDLTAQIIGRGVEAKLRAREGGGDEAEALAAQAVALAMDTDLLTLQGDAHADLAEVLRLSGRLPEAERAFRAALEIYKQKGNHVSAGRTGSQLEHVFAT